MNHDASTRRWLSTAILAVGSLATLATSAPDDFERRGAREFHVPSNASRRVQVSFDEAAMSHMRSFDGSNIFVRADGSSVHVVWDEGLPEARVGADAVWVFVPATDFPPSGPLTIGLTIESTGDAATISLEALGRVPGAEGLFASNTPNREFPDSARISIEVEGE